ncbi:hypothetical protein P153DRAFT_364864 [Dothidotthia symphoricarpi CBS 119687]|uniref:NAD(P)-binding domain-containing protein n=1 Tax=Dothidotthia symphoricarpi CBS 119687 TaxID=1392245 RepID=A0A6A6AK05_9PLEO|nr:uncharacterized protein P153DRAFT_364864 [Dothidotthia symphoricarpi CBS 119687]KAF2131254.1 hypothetical protein P153DRAFT_364864 [Dothidotthia symphoricarpi CBS 119687]
MAPRVLILGGNAGISRLMTTAMLARSWDVVSVIRRPGQKSEIEKLGQGQNGKVTTMVYDLEKVRGAAEAQSVLEQAKPNFVIFAAGSMSNPFGVDRDAAKSFMRASADTPTVTKFLFISFPAARRNRAPWWSDSEYRQYVSERSSYPDIQQAKLDADEYLVALANKRAKGGGAPFQAISLRPTWLTNARGTGKVQLGHAGAQGQVTRKDTADVAVGLLARDDTRGWFDLFEGSVGIEEAIDGVVRDGVNSIQGEDVERMYKLVQ